MPLRNTHPEVNDSKLDLARFFIDVETLGERKICILEAATDILIKKGYHNFTMRKIAKQARMHLKTLQHYYPTKKDLLRGTITYAISKQYKEYAKLLEKLQDDNPLQTFRSFIQYLLDSLKDPVTNHFFLEFWALSSRDQDAALAMDTLYTYHRRAVGQLIQAINPTLSEYKRVQRAFAVIAMIEGMLLFMGHNKPNHKELQDIDKEVINIAIRIVLSE